MSKSIIQIKNVYETIKYLNERKYEIYIITNGPQKAVNDKLSQIGVYEYVKDIFTADEAGYMKPHDIFYEKLFQKLDSQNKEEMLVIGDELEKDILGGIKNGIDSCWLNMRKLDNKSNLKPTYEINNLLELKSIL